MKMKIDHVHILTMDEEMREFEDGSLVFEGETISYVGDFFEDSDIPSVDYKGKLLIPGLVNGHTHLGMVSFRTLGDDLPNRLHRLLMPLEEEMMTPELAYASAKAALAEMLLSGITSVADMYYFEDAIAQAVEEMGIRGWLGVTLTESQNCEVKSEEEGLFLAENFIKKYRNHPTITPMPAPHASYSVTLEGLKKAQSLAKEYGTPWMVHLSEMDFEIKSFQEKYGKTPIRWFYDEDLLDERLMAVHCNFATEEDLSLLKEKGVHVVHCPGANAKGAKGVAKVLEMKELGVNVCLGTDGPASGNTLDMFFIIRLYGMLQKNRTMDRRVAPALETLKMATVNGAKALHRLDIGSLEVGKKADFFTVNKYDINLLPCIDPYSAIVYGAHPSNVRDVFVGGRQLVKGGELTEHNVKTIVEEFLTTAEPFIQRAKTL